MTEATKQDAVEITVPCWVRLRKHDSKRYFPCLYSQHDNIWMVLCGDNTVRYVTSSGISNLSNAYQCDVVEVHTTPLDLVPVDSNYWPLIEDNEAEKVCITGSCWVQVEDEEQEKLLPCLPDVNGSYYYILPDFNRVAVDSNGRAHHLKSRYNVAKVHECSDTSIVIEFDPQHWPDVPKSGKTWKNSEQIDPTEGLHHIFDKVEQAHMLCRRSATTGKFRIRRPGEDAVSFYSKHQFDQLDLDIIGPFDFIHSGIMAQMKGGE